MAVAVTAARAAAVGAYEGCVATQCKQELAAARAQLEAAAGAAPPVRALAILAARARGGR